MELSLGGPWDQHFLCLKFLSLFKAVLTLTFWSRPEQGIGDNVLPTLIFYTRKLFLTSALKIKMRYNTVMADA